MDKVIKEFNNKNLIYQLGYNLWRNKAFLRIEIYENKELFSVGYRCIEAYKISFVFNTASPSLDSYGSVDTIKEMFNKLREHSEIPKGIEREYESLFVMYKLNDFNEI